MDNCYYFFKSIVCAPSFLMTGFLQRSPYLSNLHALEKKIPDSWNYLESEVEMVDEALSDIKKYEMVASQPFFCFLNNEEREIRDTYRQVKNEIFREDPFIVFNHSGLNCVWITYFLSVSALVYKLRPIRRCVNILNVMNLSYILAGREMSFRVSELELEKENN